MMILSIYIIGFTITLFTSEHIDKDLDDGFMASLAWPFFWIFALIKLIIWFIGPISIIASILAICYIVKHIAGT